MEHRIFQVPDNGSYLDDPPRLVYRTQRETDQGPGCEITTIDLRTEIRTSYVVPSACFPEFSDRQGWEYYRVLDDSGEQVDVIRVDTMTGQSTTIFTGEIEQIGWISPDEHYAAFVLDYNGSVDTAPGRYAGVRGSVDAQMVVLDLTNGKRLFETNAYPGGIAEEWMPIAYVVTDDWLILSDMLTTHVVHIKDNGVAVNSVEGSVGRHIASGWTILWPAERLNEFGSVAQWSLYNLSTQEEILVVDLGGYVRDYSLNGELEYLGDGIFQVIIGYGGDVYRPDETPPFYDLAAYKIRIPGVNIESS